MVNKIEKKKDGFMNGGLPITHSGSLFKRQFCCHFNHLQGKDNGVSIFKHSVYACTFCVALFSSQEYIPRKRSFICLYSIST